MFEIMFIDGAINIRGLRQNLFIVDEVEFDINTAYIEYNCDNDYAVSFMKKPTAAPVMKSAGSSLCC